MGAKYVPPLRKTFFDCEICAKRGRCLSCRGTGRAGAFLRVPPPTAPVCNWCKGSTLCSNCGGTGIRYFQAWPSDIFVQNTLPPAKGMMSGMGQMAMTHIWIPRNVLPGR